MGSYAQPDWLINRDMLSKRMPPRVRASELWRVPLEWLEQAQDDATLLAIRDQERAGLDILTDGEMRRESYSNRFATALDGLDLDNPGKVISRSGHEVLVPRIVGKIRRKHAVQVRDIQFLRANTDRKIKITVPGPFTMTQQAVDEFYKDEKAVSLDYAAAVNEEIKDLFAAGADVVQIDEPWMQASPDKARAYGVTALNRALDGVRGTTAVHICFGYAALVAGRPEGYSFLPELEQTPVQQVSIETAQSKLDCSVLQKLPSKTVLLGVLDLSTPEIETPETVAERIRRALPFISPDRLIIAPDCGLKYLPREVAFGKMKAMADGAKIVRTELQ
ncbi:MAG: 5-methyltetrahydropteroyltriglutamate--homocysteine methyltransferase [Acidobacteriia bacterium]|nr:5-methyltetrahydropteroyltriglutamate--homocysteine methyltransferase [Terriglobia bacterium]